MDFGSSPSPAAVRRAVQAARAWLEATLVEAGGTKDLSPTTACRLLCGFWLCSRLDAKSVGERFMRERARRIVEALSPRPGSNDWAAVPLNLRLVAATVLQRSRVEHPALNGPAGCLEQVRSALAGTDPAQLKTLPSTQLARLLVEPGSPHALLRFPLDEVLEQADMLSLAGPQADVNKIAAAADAHCVQGCLPPADLRRVRPVARLITGFALAALRNYDFVRGCQLLRSAQRLGARDRLTGAGLAYLLFHQRPEGAFGFFGSEELALEVRARRQRRTISAALELSLPVTVECVWTLLEGGSQVRLVPSLLAEGAKLSATK